jgi:hypothetical protein
MSGTALQRAVTATMADPDPFPSSYPVFAPTSWSSVAPKTRHNIVEAPKDKCGAATNQQNINKCQMTTRHRRHHIHDGITYKKS